MSIFAASSKRLVPWNPWAGVAFVIAAFFASQIAAGLLVALFAGIYNGLIDASSATIADAFESSVPTQFAYIALAEAITVGAIILFVKKSKGHLPDIGLRRPRWSDVAYALAAVVPYYILFALTVGVVSQLIPGLDVDQDQQIGFEGASGTLELGLVFLALAILVPIAEEVAVRGLLYSSFRKALPLIYAAVATSLVFGAAHLPEGGPAGPLYIAALDTFVLSLVLIYLRDKTGGLWAPIGLHAIKNSVAFLALFVFKVQ